MCKTRFASLLNFTTFVFMPWIAVVVLLSVFIGVVVIAAEKIRDDQDQPPRGFV